MNIKNLISILVLFSLLTACQLTVAPPLTQPSGIDAVGTAVELTTVAKFTEIAGSAVPPVTATFTAIPTPTLTPDSAVPVSGTCGPTVTATVNANVRSGPGTAYDTIGSLMLGQTATIVGRNDAYTWWYIAYPGVSGGYAWIAGSVVTSACVPSVVQVVAAPPLPTEEVVAADSSSGGSEDAGSDGDAGSSDGGGSSSSAMPDLIISEFTITPATPVMGQTVHVRIGAYNQGNAVSGPYTVVWYGLSTFANPSCSWNVDKSNAHGGRILKCDFVFNSWYPLNKTSLAIVDPNNQVSESNEGNNQGAISPFGVAKP